MQIRLLDVPVDGGNLRVLVWGTGTRVAVAVHGITASAMAWQAVPRQMPAGWTLAAPDLRGRGHSAGLPGPWGLERHAADVTAVLRHFGGGAGPGGAFDGRVRGAAGQGREPEAVATARPGRRRRAAAGTGRRGRRGGPGGGPRPGPGP